MRVLFDTNILLDFFLQRQPFLQDTQAIFVEQQKGRFTGYITSITVVNIYYIARKNLGNAQARAIVQSILGMFRVVPINKNLLQSSLILPIQDYEDAVQVSAAINRKVDVIVTRDLKDYQNSPVTVYEPSDFLTFIGK